MFMIPYYSLSFIRAQRVLHVLSTTIWVKAQSQRKALWMVKYQRTSAENVKMNLLLIHHTKQYEQHVTEQPPVADII